MSLSSSLAERLAFPCHEHAPPCSSYTRDRCSIRQSGFLTVPRTKTWIAGHAGTSLRSASRRARSKHGTQSQSFQLRSDAQRAALPSEYPNSIPLVLPGFALCRFASRRCTVGRERKLAATALRLPRPQNHIPIIVANLIPIWGILSVPLARRAE